MTPERKAEIDKLRVIHCFEAVGTRLYEAPTKEDFARWDAAFPETEQPLVWHQKDGRSSLLIGGTAFYIKGMSREEGRKLLNELEEWCTQAEFTYRHTWTKGDMVMFNNPGLLHRSLPYDPESGRIMHRTTIKGMEEIESRETVSVPS